MSFASAIFCGQSSNSVRRVASGMLMYEVITANLRLSDDEDYACASHTEYDDALARF